MRGFLASHWGPVLCVCVRPAGLHFVFDQLHANKRRIANGHLRIAHVFFQWVAGEEHFLASPLPVRRFCSCIIIAPAQGLEQVLDIIIFRPDFTFARTCTWVLYDIYLYIYTHIYIYINMHNVKAANSTFFRHIFAAAAATASSPSKYHRSTEHQLRPIGSLPSTSA